MNQMQTPEFLAAKAELQPHQQRIVEELEQLADRALKLGAFINSERFDSIDKMEQRRMLAQSVHMLGYLEVLQQRVNAF